MANGNKCMEMAKLIVFKKTLIKIQQKIKYSSITRL